MADFVYEKLRAGTTQNDSDSGSEVARKFNDNFEKVAEKFTEISEKLASGLSISVNGTILQVNSEGIVELPLVSPTQAGLVQSSDGEDAIVADENNGTMKVASLNVSKLIENDDVIFILDGGNSVEPTADASN